MAVDKEEHPRKAAQRPTTSGSAPFLAPMGRNPRCGVDFPQGHNFGRSQCYQPPCDWYGSLFPSRNQRGDDGSAQAESREPDCVKASDFSSGCPASCPASRPSPCVCSNYYLLYLFEWSQILFFLWQPTTGKCSFLWRLWFRVLGVLCYVLKCNFSAPDNATSAVNII